MSDDDARALARALTKMGEYKLSKGDVAGAEAAFARAERLLTSTGHADNDDVHKMTSAQLQRRGRGVAAAKATNALAQAVAADPRWGSMLAYARSLRVSKQSLSAYVLGQRKCPSAIAERVRRDFPELRWVWPAGMTE